MEFPSLEKVPGKGVGRTVSTAGVILVPVGMEKVQKRLSADLRPGRNLVSVVKYASGKIEEFAKTLPPETVADPPKAAATVAKPNLGCPEPRLGRSEIKARGVLKEFLTDEQYEDFMDVNQFVSVGALTGHRYMITSRHSAEGLSRYGGRQLFDPDDQRSFCVHHDHLVPAAEEMLSLHLLLQLPRHETYFRGLG